MKDQELNSAHRRRLILLAILTLGVAGGAAGDAIITLQRGNAPYYSAITAPQSMAPSSSIVTISETTTEQGPLAEDECSCVEGAALSEASSPLAPRRSHKRGARRHTPMRLDLCAMTAALE